MTAKLLKRNVTMTDELIDKYSQLTESKQVVRQFNIRYGKIVLATDMDYDGFHIRGLCLGNFQKLWRELIDEGYIYFLRTPIIKVNLGKTVLEFLSQDEYNAWAKTNTKKCEVSYIKGLGGNESKDFEKYMVDPQYTIRFVSNPKGYELLDVVFDVGKGTADKRKDWLLEERP